MTLPQDGAAFSAWWPPWPSWAGARPMSKTWIVQSILFFFKIYCWTKCVQKYNISDTKLLSQYYSPYFVIFTVHEPVRAVKSEDRMDGGKIVFQLKSYFTSIFSYTTSGGFLARDHTFMKYFTEGGKHFFWKILFTSCLDQGPPLREFLLHLLRSLIFIFYYPEFRAFFASY